MSQRIKNIIKVTYLEHMGSDLSVVNAARVSFGKTSEWNPDWRDDHYTSLLPTDAKLIKYLAKHKHMSPFGHCFASFHVSCPLYVHAQLTKHKYLRSNTISRRYVDDDPEFYVPPVWRGRSEDKKQGSSGVITEGQADLTIGCSNARALQDYKKLLELGVCPEQARGVLPTSTMTEFWWSGSLDAWAKMCVLRMAPDSQYESQLVAKGISGIMSGLFKASWAALVPVSIRPFNEEESARSLERSKINKN